MKNATMLYRCPGPVNLEGVLCEHTVVDEHEVDDKLAEGWNRTWHGAADDAKARDAAQLQANEQELQKVEQQLQEAGASDLVGEEPGPAEAAPSESAAQVKGGRRRA